MYVDPKNPGLQKFRAARAMDRMIWNRAQQIMENNPSVSETHARKVARQQVLYEQQQDKHTRTISVKATKKKPSVVLVQNLKLQQ